MEFQSQSRCFPLVLWLLLSAASGCGGPQATAFGEAVAVASAVPLAELLSAGPPAQGATVVVSGRIKEVCRSSGCWFVLEDFRNGRAWELLVDLKPSASFTVQSDIIGRRATVSGLLAGRRPDLRLNALGLVLQ